MHSQHIDGLVLKMESSNNWRFLYSEWTFVILNFGLKFDHIIKKTPLKPTYIQNSLKTLQPSYLLASS